MVISTDCAALRHSRHLETACSLNVVDGVGCIIEGAFVYWCAAIILRRRPTDSELPPPQAAAAEAAAATDSRSGQQEQQQQQQAVEPPYQDAICLFQSANPLDGTRCADIRIHAFYNVYSVYNTRRTCCYEALSAL